VYGQINSTLTDAENDDIPANLPPIIDKMGCLLAKVIIRQGSDTLVVENVEYFTFERDITVDHNELAGLQGGQANEYYHLTAAEHTLGAAMMALTPTDSNFIVGDGSTWVAESGATARTSLGLGTADNVEFAGITGTSLNLSAHEVTCGSINRATGTLTLEVGGTPQLSLSSTVATFAGTVVAAGGNLNLGVDDTTRGVITAYGPSTGVYGGTLSIHTGAEHDDTIDSYYVRAYEDDLQIGGTAGVAITVAGTTVTFAGDISATNYTAANLLTACATNAGALDFSAASKTLTVEDDAIVSQDYSTDGSPQFAALGIGIAAPSSSVGLLSVKNLTLNTAEDYLGGIQCRLIKTAGASDENNDIYGVSFDIEYGQSGGTIGTFVGTYTRIDHTDGDVGTALQNEQLRSLFIGCGLSGGKVFGDVHSFYMGLNQTAGHELTGDLNGGFIYVSAGGTVGGTASLMKVKEGSNVDYAFYHDGSIPSYFGGGLGLGVTPKTKLTVEGTITLKEQAAADGDTATYGQIWVKNTTPNTLWFTDDGGTDHQLTGGGGSGVAGADTQVQFNDTGSMGADADFTWNKTNNDLTVGTLTVGSSGVTDSTGEIDFDNENLTTTGTLDVGAVTTTENITIDKSAGSGWAGIDIIAPATKSAAFRLTASAGGANEDYWQVLAADGGNLEFYNKESGSYVTKLTIDKNGLITATGNLNMNSNTISNVTTISGAMGAMTFGGNSFKPGSSGMCDLGGSGNYWDDFYCDKSHITASDPDILVLSPISSQRASDLLAYVPEQKKGATLFFNKDTDKINVAIGQELYEIPLDHIGALPPAKKKPTTKTEYKFNNMTGDVESYDKPQKEGKFSIVEGVELRDDGNFYNMDSDEIVSKENAVEMIAEQEVKLWQ